MIHDENIRNYDCTPILWGRVRQAHPHELNTVDIKARAHTTVSRHNPPSGRTQSNQLRKEGTFIRGTRGRHNPEKSALETSYTHEP